MLENIKNQLVLISIVGVVFGGCAFSMLLFTDPYKASWIIISLLYVSLFGFLLSLFSLISYGIRTLFTKEMSYKKLQVGMRQSSLLALLIISFLILSSHQLLYWWLALVSICTVVFIEAFFLSH